MLLLLLLLDQGFHLVSKSLNSLGEEDEAMVGWAETAVIKNNEDGDKEGHKRGRPDSPEF